MGYGKYKPGSFESAKRRVVVSQTDEGKYILCYEGENTIIPDSIVYSSKEEASAECQRINFSNGFSM